MDIGKYLKENKVSFQIHEHPPAYTAQEVAAEEHVSGKMMAKPVLVWTGQAYALCVLPANQKLDMGKAAKAMKAKKVRLADEGELAKVFPDIEVGAEPPFGNLYKVSTFVDERLAADEEIVFQAGTHRHAIRMKFKDYAALAKPAVADLAVEL